MKNADGTYRIMPGFASLFGRMGHPPISSENVTIAESPTSLEKNTIGNPTGTGNDSSNSNSNSGGCPVKHDGGSLRAFQALRRGGAGPGSDNLSSSSSSSACPVKAPSNNSPQQTASNQQYDVYSRPLPLDPTNNMPLSNPNALATNSLPSARQTAPLPTERVPSTIPKGGAADDTATWTYPSPQMFYNALARKGKLGDTKEEDMESVVALHNNMNEGTWKKVLEWEAVLNPSEEGGNGGGGPKLSKFMGRPTDLSPKAFLKHYLLGHPLPFDRHDWTVQRADGTQVRYVIDYYHDDAVAREEDGSGLPDMHDHDSVKSLLVDVRPAADGVGEIWGRAVTMPLARRGFGPKTTFLPLPMVPSESLRMSVGESREVWANIQKDAAAKKGVGAKDDACASDSLDDANNAEEEISMQISPSEAQKIAESFSRILSQCEAQKKALKECNSEEECNKAYMGMTVCAGQFLCPLQHYSFLQSLEGYETAAEDGKNEGVEMAEAKINIALDVLGQCVAHNDKKAAEARRQFPDVFDEVLKKSK